MHSKEAFLELLKQLPVSVAKGGCVMELSRVDRKRRIARVCKALALRYRG